MFRCKSIKLGYDFSINSALRSQLYFAFKTQSNGTKLYFEVEISQNVLKENRPIFATQIHSDTDNAISTNDNILFIDSVH